MKTGFVISSLLIPCLFSIALGQQAKLEGHVFDDKDNRVTAARIVAPGGQAAETDSRGHFIIVFPSSVQPGQATRIEVSKLNWVIYEPLLGNCVTQSSARNYEPLKVIIVPKGSPLALSPKRISQVIAKLSDERVKLRGQVAELRSQLTEDAFLRDYSEEYGFTLEQFLAAAQQWAQIKDSDDKEDRALKEYFLKNYERSAQLAHESALVADAELEQDNTKRIENSLKVIRRFKLEGNSFYAHYKFREALAAYNEIAQRFATRKLAKEDLIGEWAETKLMFGNTKSELGTRVEGQESQSLLAQSVEAYGEALRVYTREQQPQDWAMTQNNLGAALSAQGQRLEGAEGVWLLAQAVDAYREALKVYTREHVPQDWAMTQNNLGSVLILQGERLEGAEGMRLLAQSLEAHREALNIRTREQLPQQWAMTQNNLGAVLSAQGERLEGAEGVLLLASSVEAYREALKVRTREQLPQDWAMTQNNLGNVLRSQGERLEGAEGVRLLTQSVEAYREALKVRTREQLPQQWAATQNNLGLVLSAQGQRLQGTEGMWLLTQAVEAYREALKIRTREQLPQDWAMTQNNLGIVLHLQGERLEGAEGLRLLAQSLEAYREALKVRTREQLPQQWAATQNNMGLVLSAQGQRFERTEGMPLMTQAVEAYREALNVHTREQNPQRWVMTQNNLARAYFLLRNWPGAAESYANVLTLYPDYEEAYRRAGRLYHNELFRFEEAFAVNQRWLARHPGDVSAQASLAETHFTTGRFAECGQRINALLTKAEFPVSTKTALRAIEIANLLALGQGNGVPVRMEELISEISHQPPDFKVEWRFDGTRHFIGQSEKLSSYRIWLNQFFDALASKDREAMLDGLRQARASFKET